MEEEVPRFRRSLIVRRSDGTETPFEIYIGRPHVSATGDFFCVIQSTDVIFDGEKKIYGVDEIDCLDQAIFVIDSLSTDFAGGTLLWPDRSPYRRVPTTKKMGWG
ncbi:hypothetical protein [Devosia sp. FKR38]|uniref:hypothetical protein n=1 Tax=Devosia sp. FKR38 TaxID=2562312 RepID=UPI0010C09C18|nr:hypothetical protein [Devosia sp. FKR38]